MSTEITLYPPVPAIYTKSLLVPKAFKGKDGTEGQPRYNAQFLLPGDHLQVPELMTTCLKLADAAFPARGIKAMVQAQGLQAAYLTLMTQGLGLPLKNGNTMLAAATAAGKDRPFYKDVWVLMAAKPEKNKAGAMLAPPALRVLVAGKIVAYDDAARPMAADAFYNGVLVSGKFQFKEFAGFGGGVTCYLDRLLSMNTGTKIEIGISDEDTFGSPDRFTEYSGTVTNENVLASPGASPW